ncbi:MAG: TrmB family transcriptional regulator, partial [Candidatus Hydrothermarchaeota archaeon]
MNTSIEEKLKLFGLNKYEALAYITIVKYAVSSAREISKFSGVPYSRIYDVLDSLEKKGWIFVESGKPLRYKANNLKSILDKIEKQTMKELSETKKI